MQPAGVEPASGHQSVKAGDYAFRLQKFLFYCIGVNGIVVWRGRADLVLGYFLNTLPQHHVVVDKR